jgi:SPP1 gp7 family putative phage head morphogenesis protein
VVWSATAEVERFDEAVDWFRNRFPVTPELAAKLGKYAGARAWTIAGVAQLDVVLDTYESLLKAVEKGTPLKEWQDEIEEKLTKAWGRQDSARIETIFRNATQQSFNAGRWRQMNEPAIKALRPYVLFDGINDGRQSKICLELDGTVVEIDDPWLETHSPQLHHRCRSKLRSLSAKQAKERGVTEAPQDLTPSPGFGKIPDDVAEPWKPDPKDYPAEVFQIYEKKNTATKGVHFKELVSNVSAAQQQVAFDALADYGLLPFLERQPLDRLELVRTIRPPKVQGLYYPSVKRVVLRMKEPAQRSWNGTFVPGKSFTCAEAAETWTESVRRNALHEVGHHIHLSIHPSLGDRSTVRNFYQRALKANTFITRYAATDEDEYFAECFSAYKLYPKELEAHDPGGFRMVESVLRSQGIIE